MAQSDFEGSYGASRHTNLSFERLDDYYHGSQPLSYLHPEIRAQVNGRLRSLVVNWPRLIVDSIEDRLDVEGFRLGGGERGDGELWRLWQANDLDEASQQAHLDALIFGRSFALVWPNADDPTTPRITVESALQMRVEYDPGTRLIRSAVKEWREGTYDYRTVYDRMWITRYGRPVGSEADYEFRAEPIPNVFGFVPVVPFINRPTLLRPQGESEMTDVIPLTDAINKLSTDMMVTAEYTAMPRRWATGIDLGGSDAEADRTAAKIKQRWEEAQGQKVWATDSDRAQFGQFPEATLANYVAGIDMLTARVAAIAGLPPHYFGQAGENPASADALRSSESALIKKVLRKQRVFGGAWERVMRMALTVRGDVLPDGMRSLETIWRAAETPTLAQAADAALKKVQGGIIDAAQAREDLGYTPAQRQRMVERERAAALGPVRAQLDEAARLQREDGLSQPAAFAAVGLLQSAALQAQPPS